MIADNDIVYGKEPLGPRIVAVQPLEDYRLLLDFTNGERRIYDVKPLLEAKVFQPLKNRGFFNSVKVAYGTIEWPGDIDLCPDTLYMESAPVEV